MSSRNVYDLHEIFRPRVLLWQEDCDKASIPILITCTRRTSPEQNALWCIGRTTPGVKCIPIVRPMGLKVTNAKGGESAHQYGLGLDFVINMHGKLDWSGTDNLWNEAIRLAQQRVMESLRPMESAHLQHPNWKALSLNIIPA